MSGRKVFTREVLASADVQGFLMDQTVMRFATSNARSAAIPAPTKNTLTILDTARLMERYDGSAWRIHAGVPYFASVALRDAYFAAPNNSPVAGSTCGCNGVVMTHDGTAWRFIATGTVSGVTDASGFVTSSHSWGQAPVTWGPAAVAQSSDTLTYLAKPIAWSGNSAGLTARFTRTDTNAPFAGNPLSCSYWVQF